MHIELLSALDKFDLSMESGKYRLFNCPELPYLLRIEYDLATALAGLDRLSGAEWEAVRARIDKWLAAKLRAFSLRMATMAIRSRKVEFLECGIIGLILDKDIQEDRDVCAVCCVLYDAANRIGTSPELAFKKMARFATPGRSNLLHEYLAAESYVKSIKSMGVEVVD